MCSDVKLQMQFKYWLRMFPVIMDRSVCHKTTSTPTHENCMTVHGIISPK